MHEARMRPENASPGVSPLHYHLHLPSSSVRSLVQLVLSFTFLKWGCFSLSPVSNTATLTLAPYSEKQANTIRLEKSSFSLVLSIKYIPPWEPRRTCHQGPKPAQSTQGRSRAPGAQAEPRLRKGDSRETPSSAAEQDLRVNRKSLGHSSTVTDAPEGTTSPHSSTHVGFPLC